MASSIFSLIFIIGIIFSKALIKEYGLYDGGFALSIFGIASYYYFFSFTAPIRIFEIDEDYCCIKCIHGNNLSVRPVKDKNLEY